MKSKNRNTQQLAMVVSHSASAPPRLCVNKSPVALTIAGSDSGGGAGIQADLKTFAALGVHGTTVITCLTAQNPKHVLGIEACTPAMVRKQMEAVFEVFPPQAMKTGMLYSEALIKEVVRFLRGLKRKPTLVVDPVFVATSGNQLLQPRALATLQQELLPMADLITPNIPETEALTGSAVRDPEQMRAAARALHGQYGCAILVKGGHLAGFREAVDIYFDRSTELLLSAPRSKGGHTIHGTGCTLSAAITAYCALGVAVPEAVQAAKKYVTSAIEGSVRVTGHLVLVPQRRLSAL